MKKHFFAVIGVLFLAVAVFFTVSSVRTGKRCTEAVTATVINYKTDYDSEDNSTAYFPVLKYSVDGTMVEAVAGSGSGKKPYIVGTDTAIRYNPDDPTEFVFEGDNSAVKWGIYLVIVSIGCIVLDVLSAKGIVKTAEHATRRRVVHRDGGLSLDLRDITGAVGVAKTMKGTFDSLKGLSAEERKAYFEEMRRNPQKYMNLNQSQSTDEEDE